MKDMIGNLVDMQDIKKRDRTFDLLKLYAMLSVVLDHSLQHMIGGEIQTTQLYNWIFLSQMPIFIFVSGYFAFGGLYKNTSISAYFAKLVKTIASLLIPFISFAIVVSLLNKKNIIFKAILIPDFSLWFLWVLMWMQIIMLTAQQITKYIVKNDMLKIFVSIGFYFVGLIPVGLLFIKWPDFFQTKLIIFYSVFFLFGYFYSFAEKNIRALRNNKFKLACIPVTLCIVTAVMIVHPTVIYDADSTVNVVARFCGSFAAIILVMYILSFVVRIKCLRKISVFGILSLEMYYIHLLILKIPFFNSSGENTIVFVLKYVLLVYISLIVIFILKKNQIVDFVIFGKIPSKKKR